MTQAPTKSEPFEEQFIEQYKQYRELAGAPRKTNPYHRAMHDPMWIVLPLLKLPFLLWFFTSGRVTLPVLQDRTTLVVLIAAIVFFHALWFALLFLGVAWERRQNRRAIDF
jgi:hypothetical protein